MKNLLCFTLILLSLPAFAEEFYRQKLHPHRYFGADQGNVGSCQAEAETAALESAFHEKGYAVRLSAFYLHARIFQQRIASEPIQEKKQAHLVSGMVRYNSEDLALLDRMGDVVPYFMLPDDTMGYRPTATGIRPHLTKLMAPDASYKPTSLTRNQLTLLPGYKNTGTLDQLKAQIKAGHAITLIYDPDFLMRGDFFDDRTGLLKRGVNLSAAPYDAATHASALVGFDDSLYADYGFSTPGALIIKNSWNSNDLRDAALGRQKLDEQTIKDLKSMRLKLSKGQNLPGYYAIPYEFVKLALSRGKNIGYTVLALNFDEFAAQYFKLAPDYKVKIAPFICGAPIRNLTPDDSSTKRMILQHAKYYYNALTNEDRTAVAQDSKKVTDLVAIQLRPRDGRNGTKQFKYAYFSQHEKSGVDRVRDFYSGNYNDYYCFAGRGEEFNQPEYLYPHLGFYLNKDFRSALDFLSKDVLSSAHWFDFLSSLFYQELENEKVQ